MKKIKFIVSILFISFMFVGNIYSQESGSLAQRLNLVEKQNKAFNFYLNMQNNFNSVWQDGKFQSSYFENHQLRLEARGSIVDGVSYRLRHRLNKPMNRENIDNISKATDIASISVRLMDGLNMTLGKQCTAYGGFEFDLNPIDIYEYSDMIEYMDNFLAGVDFSYTIANQEFRFQVVEARSSSLDKIYSGFVKDNKGDIVEVSKTPFIYTLNWNGNLMDGSIQTRWSYSMSSDAKDRGMNYIALGNQFKITNEIKLQLDWMHSKEDIDRKGIASDILSKMDASAVHATDVTYNSFVAKVDLWLLKDVNLFLKGMYETVNNGSNMLNGVKDEYRKSYGYFAGIEYTPFADNIKFFATYIGRKYDYDDSVVANSNLKDYNTSRFSLGIIYRLKMF